MKFKDEVYTELEESDITKARNKGTPNIFWACSKHENCANDHEAYQGKIYIDEKWKSVTNPKDKRLISRIEDYIKQNNIQTIQSVIDDPVWLTTRPNCRHRFKSLTAEEVLSNRFTLPESIHKTNRYKKGDSKMKNKDSQSQEIGKAWRQLAEKNNMRMVEMDKLYTKFMETEDFKNWKDKNNMDIIFSEEMFDKFGDFFKKETGKKFITLADEEDTYIEDVNPRKGEKEEDFLRRFMKETVEEYPDEKQRFAVAKSYWERKDKVKDAKHTVSEYHKNNPRLQYGLNFHHKNGKVYPVRERTLKEIKKSLNEVGIDVVENATKKGEFEYVEGSQSISDMNGCIYAEFVDYKGYTHDFMIADYDDYIDEIKPLFKKETIDSIDHKIEIKQAKGHYEGYIDGKFILSGDSYSEVKKDLEEYLADEEIPNELDNMDNVGLNDSYYDLSDWFNELDYHSIGYSFVSGGYGIKFGDKGSYSKAKSIYEKLGLDEGYWYDDDLEFYNYKSERISNDFDDSKKIKDGIRFKRHPGIEAGKPYFDEYDNVIFAYDNLPIKAWYLSYPGSRWQPAEYDDYETTVYYEYEPYDWDEVRDLIRKWLREDEPEKYDKLDDDDLNEYIYDNYKEVVTKYYSKLYDYFEDAAIEEAEEKYEPSDDYPD